MWKVGKGDKILFWQDSWMGQEPLIYHLIFDRWADQCIGRFGFKVCDYRNGDEWHNFAEISQDLLPLMTSLNATFTNLDRDTLI